MSGQLASHQIFVFAPVPGVNDVLLSASLSVAVEDEVTVSTVELTIGGGLHRLFITTLNSPDLN